MPWSLRILMLVLLLAIIACGTTQPTVEVPPASAAGLAPPRNDCPTQHGFAPATKGGQTACQRVDRPLAPDAETWRCPDTGYLFWVPAGKGDQSRAKTPGGQSNARDPQSGEKPDCGCANPQFLHVTM